jgi:OmpA-OmpF porin, OOP family
MRKLAIALALASTTLATPAFARDHSPYVGVEAGGMLVEDQDFGYTDNTIAIGRGIANAYTVNYGLGWDVDFIGGYDFGVFRVEGELGYKRAKVDSVTTDARIAPAGTGGNLDGGHISVFSAMANVLLDFGNQDALSGYIGGGAGLGSFKLHAATSPAGGPAVADSDSRPAFQVIAGIRYALTPNIDLGLKYRYFTATNLKFNDTNPVTQSPFTLNGDYRSNSLLASLTYNFYAPPPPPPPPPPPATQTCPDGSVILATDTCPAPPPPPPPPPPAPERG